jgi:hypothetical protein
MLCASTRKVRAGRRLGAGLAGAGLMLLVACGGGSHPGGTSLSLPPPVTWTPVLHLGAVLDVTAPRSDGRLTVSAGGHLWLWRPGSNPQPYARGAGGYATNPAPEPYLALVISDQGTAAGCSFAHDSVVALEPTGATGVIGVGPDGRAHRLADLPGVAPNGIAFDDVGRFGHRLLVTGAAKGASTVFAVDCAGRVSTIARHAPAVEGGIAVAPSSFGTFGGHLIAPDERTGKIWAFGPDGRARLVATSPLPHGGDIGSESLGFVPAGFTPVWSAYVADRRSPGNPHPGTDSILRLSGADLTRASVQPGDLLVASEGGALTVAIRCAATCTTRYLAAGPRTAHVEGHLIFAPH